MERITSADKELASRLYDEIVGKEKEDALSLLSAGVADAREGGEDFGFALAIRTLQNTER